MSFVAPSQRRLVWPVAIALSCSMVVALLLYLPSRTTHLSTSETPGSIAAPGVTQPAWEMKTFPAGGAGVARLSKASKARIAAQRKPLAALITEVYDALFLEPAALRSVLRAHFIAPAARQALDHKLGLPAAASDVRIKRRVARVGIHMQGASRAAARIVVTGRAAIKGRRARFHHEATLWLERTRKTWKVMAFDVTQGPGR